MDTCPACTHAIARPRRLRTCLLCGGTCCKYCLVQERFCPTCAPRVPREYHEKFRAWNAIAFALLASAGLAVLSVGFYAIPNWYHLRWGDEFWSAATGPIALILVAFSLLAATLRVPHVGTRKFRAWLAHPGHLEQVQVAMAAMEAGTYQSPDRWFRRKAALVQYLRRTNNRVVHLLALGFNAGAAWFYLTRNDPTFSAVAFWADLVAGAAIALTFVVVVFAGAFYSRPVPGHAWRQRGIKFLANLVLLATLLVHGGFVVLFLFTGQIFPADPALLAALWGIHHILVLSLHGLAALLAVALLAGRPVFTMLEAPASEARTNVLHPRTPLLQLARYLVLLLLSLLLLASLVVSISLLVGEFLGAMIWDFFNLSLLVGLFLPVTLWLLQLARKHPARGPHQRFWTVVKVAAVITSINLLPLVTTPFVSTPPLDAQFAAMFGPAWQSQAEAAHAARSRVEGYASLRPTRFRLHDTLYSWPIPVNARYNTSYMTAYPRFVTGNATPVVHEFFFDAYLPPAVAFGPAGGSAALPVVVMLHGEVEDKGAWNANWTSQYLANLGYLVCDLGYGYITGNAHGANNSGYLVRDVVAHIGQFTRFLHANRAYFHADLGATYFCGRHLGGGYALMAGHGYNSTLAGLFSEHLVVRGVVPFYPVCDLGASDAIFNGIYTAKGGHPIMNGSSNPAAADYDPDWVALNPIAIANNANRPAGSALAPTLLCWGTHDYLIPASYVDRYVGVMRGNGHALLVGTYFLGVDGFDGAHFSPWGQSVLFYWERFLALTR